jgi:hypothetical protein
LKTNEQFLNEITAAMADAWLAACERRVICTTAEGHVVVDFQQKLGLFGPALVSASPPWGARRARVGRGKS